MPLYGLRMGLHFVRKYGGYGSEVTAMLDYASSQAHTIPGSNYLTQLDTMFAYFNANGVLTLMDALWIGATDTGCYEFSKYNVLNPGTNNLTEVGAGAMTHTANQGWNTDGTNYFDTGISPITDTTQYTEDDASLFVWAYAYNAIDGATCLATRVSGNRFTQIIAYSSGDHFTRLNNTTTQGSLTVADTGTGFLVADRAGANDVRLFKNGSQIASNAMNSDGSGTYPNMYMFALNNGGSPIVTTPTLKISIAGLGASFQNAGKHTELYTGFNNYMSGI